MAVVLRMDCNKYRQGACSELVLACTLVILVFRCMHVEDGTRFRLGVIFMSTA